MTPKEQEQIRACSQEIVEILYRNSDEAKRRMLEGIEQTVRQQMLQHVSPEAAFDSIHLIDGLISGIPFCGADLAESRNAAVFKGKQAMDTVLRKSKPNYGFHGRLLVSGAGVICGFSLTPSLPASVNAKPSWTLFPRSGGY